MIGDTYCWELVAIESHTAYLAIIRTCKALHWMPVHYETHKAFVASYGKWHLPGHGNFTEPLSTHVQDWSIFPGNAMFDRTAIPMYQYPHQINTKGSLHYCTPCYDWPLHKCRKYIYTLDDKYTVTIYSNAKCCMNNPFDCLKEGERLLINELTARGFVFRGINIDD